MLKKVCSVFLSSLVSLALFSQNPLIARDSAEQAHWVDSVYNTLNTKERIGQLFMVAAYSNLDEKHNQEIEKLIKDYKIGGLIFMQGGPVRQALLTNRYQRQTQVPLLIGMDLEWGLGMRLDSTISYPKQITLGAIQNDSLIYDMGQQIAEQMKILGVHVNFAPVADINSNPNNPVIGYRSFGEDKYNVTNKATAYMKGLQDAGVLACAKHFPGHGDTNTDSHFELPVVSHDMQRIDSIEYLPFKQLINKGVRSIMSAHLFVQAIDSTKKISSSLSRKTIHHQLQNKLGFKGLVFTDALNMKAVAKDYEPGMVELKALMAGNDILLFSQDIPTSIKTIRKAIRKRIVKRHELEERVKKILLGKYTAGLASYEPINTDNLVLKLNNPKYEVLNRSLYENAITIIENKEDFLPLQLLDTLQLASISINGKHSEFNQSINKYLNCAEYQYNTSHRDSLLTKLSQFNTVIVSVRAPNQPKNNFVIDKDAIDFVKQLSKKTKVVTVIFGSPYASGIFEGSDAIICAYEDHSITQNLVPQLFFGGLASSAKLPVSSDPYSANDRKKTTSSNRLAYSIPEDVGMSSKILNKIDRIAYEAIKYQATPGMQVLVARKGKVIFEKAYGHYTYDSLRPVTNETVYDIASVTKVAATLQAILFLYDRGMIDLDKKLSYYLNELKGTNKESMTIRDILSHQAGLWPYLPFWRNTVKNNSHLPEYYNYHPQDKFKLTVGEGLYSSEDIEAKMWEWVIESKLRDKTDRKPYDYKYSDMGYYLLQRLAEKLTNQPMEDFLTQNLYEPLGLNNLGYLPLCKFPKDRIAPTENDVDFRQSLVHGTVHDQGAALLGGIAGHAGLFSNANDLAKLFQMHLQKGEYGGETYFKPSTLEEFSIPQYQSNRRGAGWDKPLLGAWYGPTSESASPSTFGHTGFTGTAAWADPEFDLIYIFLSNRIHPDANNTKLIKTNVRTRIQDLIYQSMWEFCGSNK